MQLRHPLPPGRSLAQVMNHYLVEKSLAQRLKRASREQRHGIYATMYDELFSRVPDHPRLTQRASERLTELANNNKLALVSRYLDKTSVFVEFAPGDCKFSMAVARRVKQAYGIDISDQHDPTDSLPANFKLLVYDGCHLDGVAENSVDVVFSDQLIEHLHPEDAELHFALVRRLLRPGGRYVFRAPHPLTGPHDVSRYFADEAEGFHLKEWAYGEIRPMLKKVGYSGFCGRWRLKGVDIGLPDAYFAVWERALGAISKRYAGAVAKYFIPCLYGVGIK